MSDNSSIKLDERERAEQAAEIEAKPAQLDLMGLEGNAGDVNRQDTQNTTDNGPGSAGDDRIDPSKETPSQAEGERGATDVEDDES